MLNYKREVKERKKILLVYPEIPPTYWSFKYALPLINKKVAIPPLGLLTVAAMLPDYYDVKLIDLNFMSLTDDIIQDADIVFTSSMIVQKENLSAMAKRCKSLNTPIVAGGPYPTSAYDKIENIDFFVLNEAELTLPEFLRDWENGNPKPVYKSDKKADITLSPTPRFDLLSINDYSSMALQFSRGCPYNCEFCDIIEMFGHKSRTKSAEQILNELNFIYALGWRGAVFFVDDNFIGNKRKVKELLRLITQWQKHLNYPFEFFTETSINLAEDDELLGLMSTAGFNMVFVGIETPVEETLISTNKKQNIKQDMLDSVLKIQESGIEVTAGFIVGFDNDPPDIFERQINFIRDSAIPVAMVGLLTALPNTQLYRRLKAEKRLLQDSTGNNTHDLKINFVPNMAQNKLIKGYKHIISTIYDPKTYFKRCLLYLQNVKPHQNSSRKVRLQELFILFNSFIHQIFTPYCHHYISFLVKALITKPKMFPEAVRQAIMGHHFFKITQEILAVDSFNAYARYLKDIYVNKIKEAYASIEIDRTLDDLRRAKDDFIKDLRNEYNKIDSDFRHMVEETLRNVEKALDSHYAQLSQMATYG